MSNTSSVAYLRERLDQEWPPFHELVRSVPESEMDVPGVTDEWCMKELLGHVNFWTRKGATDLRLAGSGKANEIETPGNQENVDKWNAKAASRGKATTAEVVVSELVDSHDDARRALDDATDDTLSIEVNGWTVGVRFAEDTYRHYREHSEQIRSWKQGLETSEE